ncbi:hypothetical protein OH492_22835 [Vibrio chagasii]|nr:hypothetical protein [Vibrio chagasii]
MFVDFLVRLTIGTLVILGFKLSALYFLPMVLLLLNTHHKKEFFLGGSQLDAEKQKTELLGSVFIQNYRCIKPLR